MRNLFFRLSLILFTASALAQQNAMTNADALDALQKTKQMLSDVNQRNAYIESSADAKTSDAYVDKITGSNAKNKEAIYSISSKALESIVSKAEGNPEKMKQLLDEASKNPEQFYNEHLSESEKAEIRRLSSEMAYPSGSY